MGAKGMLIDITKCIGCGSCHDACAAANGNPETPMGTLSDLSWTAVLDAGNDVYVRRLCMHCQHPTCASVCPVAALRKTEEGHASHPAKMPPCSVRLSAHGKRVACRFPWRNRRDPTPVLCRPRMQSPRAYHPEKMRQP